jgi:3-keto steroid reductase
VRVPPYPHLGGLILESYSGVGFGACGRLLEQLSSEQQTDANPQFDIPVESKDVPDERPQWSGLTLVMVCRNMQKAEAARGKLLSYLDRILETRRARGATDEYGQNFRQNLVIEIEKCDFTSVKSVVDCARGMRAKSAPYHLSSRSPSDANDLSFFLSRPGTHT